MSSALQRNSGAHRRNGALAQRLRRTRLRVVACTVLGALLVTGCADEGVTTPTLEHSQQPSLRVSGGGATDLGTLGGASSRAFGINSRGQVVGISRTNLEEGHIERAFLWQRGRGMQDLGTLGGDNSDASAINGKGQVVGESQTSSGDFHAVLWP